MKVRMLLVAEIDPAWDLAEDEARLCADDTLIALAHTRLDAFRESISPHAEHGITLYRASSVHEEDEAAELMPLPGRAKVLRKK